MALRCPACGATNRDGARFCDECGSPLSSASQRSAEGERKQVTVLFADVVRSMELSERFDPDEWTEIITGLFEVGTAAVERFGGTVDKFTGDGLMALFGAPIAQEDHAARAAHCALMLVEGAADYGEQMRARHGVDLAIRVGLNSGEVVAGSVGGSGFTAVGHTVGLAQRMESQAAAGQICLSEYTATLIGDRFELQDLGKVTVKGASAPIRMFALHGAPDLAVFAARRRTGAVRMVGRDAEWAVLCAALEDVLHGPGRVIGLVGEAGVGKSRLCDEIAALALGAGRPVHRAAGVSHAMSVPLLPIRTLLRAWIGITDAEPVAAVRARIERRLLAVDAGLIDDLPLVFDFLEVPDPARPAAQLGADAQRARVLDVLRRTDHLGSAQVGGVLVLEDLHWFDAPSVAFLAAWLPALARAQTLVVLNFRPEFHPMWTTEPFYRRVPLTSLDRAAVGDLLVGLIGTDPTVRTLTENVVERAGGNPFFVEEIVRAWAEDGTLHGRPGAYALARPVAAVRIPSTVQTVLAGRIDRLTAADKAVLQAASVIGRTFNTSLLAAVHGTSEDEIDRALRELCAAELLVRTPDRTARFWHPLTQEVVYASLLGATRRRLHEAVAKALFAASPERHDELAALIATHYEHAGEAMEAGRWHLRAGMRELNAHAGEAERRLRAAIRHLDKVPEDPDSLTMGLRARATLIRSVIRDVDVAEAHALVAEADPIARRLGRPDLLAELATAAGVVSWSTGEGPRALELWLEGVRHADRTTGPQTRDVRAFSRVGLPLLYAGLGPIRLGLAAAEDIRNIAAGDATVGVPVSGFGALEVLTWREAAVLMRGGRLVEARQGLAAAVVAYEQRPADMARGWAVSFFAELADHTGEAADLIAAERAAAESIRIGQETGSSTVELSGCGAQGLVCLLSGRSADAVAVLADTLGRRRRRPAIIDEAWLLTQLARAHLSCSDVTSALRVADQAVEVAGRQGARVLGGQALLVRARVRRHAATSPVDAAAVRADLDSATALVAGTGADTWTPFLAEERLRLDGGDPAEVAAGYDAIGATGHAGRVRSEFGLP